MKFKFRIICTISYFYSLTHFHNSAFFVKRVHLALLTQLVVQVHAGICWFFEAEVAQQVQAKTKYNCKYTANIGISNSEGAIFLHCF